MQTKKLLSLILSLVLIVTSLTITPKDVYALTAASGAKEYTLVLTPGQTFTSPTSGYFLGGDYTNLLCYKQAPGTEIYIGKSDVNNTVTTDQGSVNCSSYTFTYTATKSTNPYLPDVLYCVTGTNSNAYTSKFIIYVVDPTFTIPEINLWENTKNQTIEYTTEKMGNYSKQISTKEFATSNENFVTVASNFNDNYLIFDTSSNSAGKDVYLSTTSVFTALSGINSQGDVAESSVTMGLSNNKINIYGNPTVESIIRADGTSSDTYYLYEGQSLPLRLNTNLPEDLVDITASSSITDNKTVKTEHEGNDFTLTAPQVNNDNTFTVTFNLTATLNGITNTGTKSIQVIVLNIPETKLIDENNNSYGKIGIGDSITLKLDMENSPQTNLSILTNNYTNVDLSKFEIVKVNNTTYRYTLKEELEDDIDLTWYYRLSDTNAQINIDKYSTYTFIPKTNNDYYEDKTAEAEDTWEDGNHKDALEDYIEALKYLDDDASKLELFLRVLTDISNVEDPEERLELYKLWTSVIDSEEISEEYKQQLNDVITSFYEREINYYKALGDEYYKNGKYTEAVEMYNKAISIANEYLGLNNTIIDTTTVDEIVNTLNKTVTETNEFIEAEATASEYVSKGDLLKDKGLYEDAIAEYNKALEYARDEKTIALINTKISEVNALIKAEEAEGIIIYKENTKLKDKKYFYKVTKASKEDGTGGTVTVTGLRKKSLKTLKIAAKVKIDGANYKVTGIEKNAFKNNNKIRKAYIGKNVITIGDNAFSGCTSLRSVVINSTVLKKIGKKSFFNCTELRKVKIKSTKIKNIGKKAFKKKYGKMISFSIPKSCKKKYAKLLKKSKSGQRI